MSLDDQYLAFQDAMLNPPPAPPINVDAVEQQVGGDLSTDGAAPAPAPAPAPVTVDPVENMVANPSSAYPDGLPSLTNRTPSKREDVRFNTIEYLMENHGLDLYKARRMSEQLWGNPDEFNSTALGLGIADFLGGAYVFGVDEGVRQVNQGLETGSAADVAIGSAVAGLSSLEGIPLAGAGVKVGRKALTSDAVQDFFSNAVTRFNNNQSPIPVGMSIEDAGKGALVPAQAEPVNINPVDVELPELSSFIKMPRKSSNAPTASELGVIQTISATPEQAQIAVDTIARIRGNYPVGTSKDKFMPIEVTGGKFDDDGAFIPKLREQSYAFTPPKGTDGKKLQGKLSNAMVTDVEKIVTRAQAGDPTAVGILAEARWYRDMRVRLRSEFGGMGDVFADLLGTTSAQTDVKANFTNAVEIIRRFTRGEFDTEIAAWNARIGSGETMSPIVLQQMHKAGTFPLITNAAGSLFNANSPASMKALLNTFRDIKQGGSPKTPNFTGNLIGYSNDATIDVWAGRYLRNKAGLPYIPPPAEKAVGGKHAAGSTFDDPKVTGEFGFGQDVFAQAVGKLNKRGSVTSFDPTVGEMGADDLQAIVWFMEKEKWTKNGWTSKSGEGGSLDFEASVAGVADQGQVANLRDTANKTFKPPAKRKSETDDDYARRVQDAESIQIARATNASSNLDEVAAPVDRTILGLSAERPGKTPSNYEQAEMAAEIDDVLRADDQVVAYKATNTYGNFGGVNERAIDAEIVTRQGFDPKPLEERLVKLGIEKDQDAVFIQKVLQNPTPEQVAASNPGFELYFTKTQSAQFAEDLSARLREKGVDGFTFITDARQADRINVQARAQDGADTAGVTGIRSQFIPEFVGSPTPEMRQSAEDIYFDLVEEYGQKGFVSSANVVYSETKVFRRDTGTDWMSGGQTYGEYTTGNVGTSGKAAGQR